MLLAKPSGLAFFIAEAARGICQHSLTAASRAGRCWMNQERIIKYPLRNKLYLLIIVAIVPFLLVTVYLLISLINYSNAYDDIASNMTIANNYNLNFKEDMDESLYKLAVGSVTFDTIDDDKTLKNPYILIEELRSDFVGLMNITTDAESQSWLMSLIRNIDTLEDRVDDIRKSINDGSTYADNMEMLDNNIYILTDLIQDDIQYYIYYQTKNIESLKTILNEQIKSFMIMIIIITVVLVILEIIISGYTLNNITRPIDELCSVTQKIAKGNFEIRAGVYTNDELAILAESTNDMARNLQIMVNHIKEDERKMRHAELRLLQEQINPHFLYNTLDTIVWLIESGDPDVAVDMVMSLSEFFRLVLSKGKEYITIREEEQHIRSYLQIQQVRYHDILEYNIDIDEEIYEYKILKLTLQPLIENSLYHGIKYKRAMGSINVTGKKQDEKIILKVADTGVGMDEETLNLLREKIKRPCKETDAGFGLANVNERIRMNFGQEYGMNIDSSEGAGTTVTVTIPAVMEILP